MSKWTTDDMPDQRGRVALVTGANSGLGLEATKALAAKGAHVIMACRNVEKARGVREEIEKSVPGASLEVVELDLAALASIREVAAGVLSGHERIDLLFNNAGIMAVPRRETRDGFEWQFGVNHLGHFALTGLLLPRLLTTAKSRIVTMSSVARTMGKINFEDLNRQSGYNRWDAYGQSKKANELFAFELQRRLAESGAGTISVAAHPGLSNTNLQSTSTTENDSVAERWVYAMAMPLISQSPLMGALPELYAGTSPDVHGGELIGPDGFMAMRGYPVVEAKAQKEYDRAVAERLWDVSIELTGVDYAVLEEGRQEKI